MTGVFEKNDLILTALEIRNVRPYPLIFHKHVELIYVLDGALDICIDNNASTLNKGDLSLTFPYIIHGNKKSDAVIALVMFDPAVCIGFENVFSNMNPEIPYIRSENCPHALPYLIEKVISRNNDQSEFGFETACGYLTSLVGEVLKVMKLNKTKDNSLNLTQQILTYCMNHYTENITLNKISDDLHISKSHISHVFSSKLNCSFREYINQMCISDAKHLLKNTNKRISDIMFECGFNNQSTFNQVFNKMCGVTPREYRKRESLAKPPIT